MRFLKRLRSWWIFLVRERVGYRRPVAVDAQVVTDEIDRQFKAVAERKRRELKAMLRYLDAQTDVFRRVE